MTDWIFFLRKMRQSIKWLEHFANFLSQLFSFQCWTFSLDDYENHFRERLKIEIIHYLYLGLIAFLHQYDDSDIQSLALLWVILHSKQYIVLIILYTLMNEERLAQWLSGTCCGFRPRTEQLFVLRTGTFSKSGSLCMFAYCRWVCYRRIFNLCRYYKLIINKQI